MFRLLFDVIESRECLRKLGFEKSCRMHSSAYQMDFWSPSFEFMFFGRTDGRTDGRTVGRMDGRSDGRSDGRTVRQMDGWSEGRIVGRTVEQTGRRTGGGRSHGRLDAEMVG